MKADLRDLCSTDPRNRGGRRRGFLRKIWCEVREGGRWPDQGQGRIARLLRLPGRALGPSAHVKPDRKRVRHRASSNGAYQGISVGDNRQTHGVQARHRGCKNLAAIEGRKSV